MVYRKKRKAKKFRGHTTHGYGSMKKNRGSGHKGGAGKSGTGKRAASHKPSVWKDKKYFGKHGFIMHGDKLELTPLNLKDLEQLSDKLFAEKKIEQKDDTFIIDMAKLGYNKLLGTGKVTKKFKITTEYSSSGAVEKVKAAGGEVVILSQQKD